MSMQGEGATLGDNDDCDAWVADKAKRIDSARRKELEVEGHRDFKAGGDKLTPEQEARYREQLTEACAGQEAEVEISMLTITSPTGKYGDNPAVQAMFLV